MAACWDEKVKGVTRFWRTALVQGLWMWHSSSFGAEGGGRTQASGQEHANADLWLQQEERNLFTSYPSLSPLSNHTDSGVSRCQKKNSKPLLSNCRVRDYQLPWKFHTHKKNYVHHILLEKKLSPASHCTCVYPAQVWGIRLAPAQLSCLIGYNYWLPTI